MDAPWKAKPLLTWIEDQLAQGSGTAGEQHRLVQGRENSVEYLLCCEWHVVLLPCPSTISPPDACLGGSSEAAESRQQRRGGCEAV